jgi:hypothetical protein
LTGKINLPPSSSPRGAGRSSGRAEEHEKFHSHPIDQQNWRESLKPRCFPRIWDLGNLEGDGLGDTLSVAVPRPRGENSGEVVRHAPVWPRKRGGTQSSRRTRAASEWHACCDPENPPTGKFEKMGEIDAGLVKPGDFAARRPKQPNRL